MQGRASRIVSFLPAGAIALAAYLAPADSRAASEGCGAAERPRAAARASRALGARAPQTPRGNVTFASLPAEPSAEPAPASDAVPASGVAPPRLDFTFESPDTPWTAEERTLLERVIGAVYPVAVAVYGPPQYAITVNVRKDPALGFPGSYSPSANEISLRDAASPDALGHEILHAFRDDDMLAVSSFEEGMVRAAEVEVFNRLPEYTHWDEHHAYDYDVWYEALNKPAIAAHAGVLQGGYTSLLLRYQLAGMAWTKAFLEDPGFFARFNTALHEALPSRPEIVGDPEALAALAGSVLPQVEGLPFACWQARQAVFNDAPPEGWFLYQRVNQFTVDFFRRDAEGREVMQRGANLRWEVRDASGGILSSGTSRTGESGWASIVPRWPGSVDGRVTIVASVETPSGRLIDRAYRTAGPDTGLFGVVTDAADGTVEIRALDGNGEPHRTPVRLGAFSLPQLGTERGRFEAVFTAADGRVSTRRFNKDASRYFLVLSAAGPASCESDRPVEGHPLHAAAADVVPPKTAR